MAMTAVRTPAEFEGELQRYLYERSEEGRAVRVGEKETSEQAAIVERYTDLFTRRQLDAQLTDLGATGEERHANPAFTVVQLVQQRRTVLTRDVQVEQEDVHDLVLEDSPRFVQRSGLEDVPSLELQIDAAEQPNRRFVVDDQDRLPSAPHRAPILAAARPSAGTRNQHPAGGVYSLKMTNHEGDQEAGADRHTDMQQADLPLPSQGFRRRAWREFQRALDPLAPPRPMPTSKTQQLH